jgi:hypothetical protein
VGRGSELVVGVDCGADGGVDAAADQGELPGQREQGREDVTVCRPFQLAGGRVDVDASLGLGFGGCRDLGEFWMSQAMGGVVCHVLVAFSRWSGMPLVKLSGRVALAMVSSDDVMCVEADRFCG